MRIISWNINSVRGRLPRLLALLERHKPDVVCLQEIKTEDGGFPTMQLNAAGYRSISYGQKSYNGVAMLIHDAHRRAGLHAFENPLNSKTSNIALNVQLGFSENPVPNEARVISACVGELRVVNAYVVNGREIDSEQFKLKRRWMDAFGKWLRGLPGKPALLVIGDFNVAPADRDVWDPEGLKGRIHCTPEEREWLRNMQGERLSDLLPSDAEKKDVYTWWPYRYGAFSRDEGFRFDLALGDKTIAGLVKRVWVDREERRSSVSMGTPSDHAPLVVDLNEPRL